MFARLHSIAAAIFFTVSNTAQTFAPAPTLIYRLHAPKQSHTGSFLARTPDQALLILTPEDNGHWVFTRLTGLGPTPPKEESLVLNGFTPDQFGINDTDLEVSPDGRFAVVRSTTGKGLFLTPQDEFVKARLAVIDLKAFRIVSINDASDRMLAASVWRFNDGFLIAQYDISSIGNPGHYQSGYIDVERVVALTLPDLQVSLQCDFSLVFRPFVHTPAGDKRQVSVADVSGSCPELARLGEASSIDQIDFSNPALKRAASSIASKKYEVSDARLGICQISDVGPRENFALYSCDRSHQTWYDTLKTDSMTVLIVSIPEGKEVFSLQMPPKRPAAATIVNASGQNYLAVLEDGVDLALYRIS